MIELLPPCANACPVHTDVRGYLAAILRQDYLEAYRLIRANNPFPSVCAWICPHPCEIACRRAQVDAPLSVRNLKRFVVEVAGGSVKEAAPAGNTGKKVAVIGSGPAGLTAAYDLARAGHRVSVYDRCREPGGHFLASLPVFRLPREILRQDVEQILSAGVDFVPGTEVGKDISIKELRKKFDAVIICTGLWGGRGIDAPGFDHAGVLYALPFLHAANTGAKPQIGKQVIVLGGGNVAMDVARTAIRLGAPGVTVICLENREQMPASVWEVQDAVAEGVTIVPGYGPVEVLSDGERLTGIKVQQVESVYDTEGKFNPIFAPDVYQTFPGDTVILSIGQTPERSFLAGSGLYTDARGYLPMEQDSFAASVAGVFACGETVNGPGPAIAAVASGHRAAGLAHRYLQGEATLAAEKELKVIGALPEAIAGKVPRFARQEMPLLSPGQRALSFLPYEMGFSEPAALREAGRCLNCGLGARVDTEKCVACLTCQRLCPYGAPVVAEHARIAAEDCLACGICAAACPAGAITMGVVEADLVNKTLNAAGAAADAPAAPFLAVFACRVVSAEYLLRDRLKASPALKHARLFEVPTNGALRLEWILDAFEHGASGVMILDCRPGQCRHPGGSASCRSVLERAGLLLEQLGLPRERLYYCQPDEGEDLIGLLEKSLSSD